MTTSITWAIEGDFDRDGTYEFDLRPYIDEGSPFVIKRGVNDDGTPLVSSFEVDLDNTDGTFNRRYSASSLYGKLVPDVPIRVTADNGTVSGSLWVGYAKSWVAKFNGGDENRCTLSAQDILGAYLQASGNINVTANSSRDTDAALAAIMDVLGLVVTDDYVFEDGISDLPYHYCSNQKAIDAIYDAVRAEMGGIIFVDGSGVLQFQNRHHRLGVSGATQWGDGSNITPDFRAGSFEVTEKDTDLVDEVTVVGTAYQTDVPDQRVWELAQKAANPGGANSLLLPAGESVTFRFDLPSAALALTTPAAITDYRGNSAQNGSGTDRTSSLSVSATLDGVTVEATVSNSYSAGVYLTYLGFRAQPVSGVGQPLRMVAQKSIPNAKTARGINLAVPFIAIDSYRLLQDYAVAMLVTYRQTYPLVTLPFAWLTDDISSAMIALELGDKVRYTNTAGMASLVSHLDEWFYVVAIQHKFAPGSVPVTMVTLEPTFNYFNLDHIEYDWFTRADGALGSTTRLTAWADATNVLVASNKAKPNNSASQKPSVDIGVADMRVGVTLSGIAGTAQGGVNYRKSDASNYLRAYVDYGNSLVVLEKVVATVVTQIASAAWTPVAGGEVMVLVQGDRHRVFVDGIQYIDATSSQFNTNTKAGLFTKNTTAMSLDDWYALGLSA